MIYRAIGLMSGSSLDGLDIAYVHLHENAGKWNFDIVEADCYPYAPAWKDKLRSFTGLNALNYQLLHTEYGHYLGEQVNTFINKHQLHYKVQLISSHGHTSFHSPQYKMTAQLGDGAAIAAETGIPVVSDLRALDVALGGQGAPIVPIGDKLLFGDYDYCLNLGGIANISARHGELYIAFDVCPANRVLNMLAGKTGKEFDEDGELARKGILNNTLLSTLNSLEFYNKPYPKSLANDFGTDIVYPIIDTATCGIEDALHTYTEHISIQIKKSVQQMEEKNSRDAQAVDTQKQMLVTGGGVFNNFLLERLQYHIGTLNIKLAIPGENTVKYKEALVMALIGVLRWREENNVLASVTGAFRNSIGGAIWMGAEA